MVCPGNICRSPMAEGILRAMIRKESLNVVTDSAATSDYHIDHKPDDRARSAMRNHGIDISDLRGRQIRPIDFEEFDLLFAMDASNLNNMRAIVATPELAQKARLIMDLAPDHPLREVPGPYYGGDEGFEEVYEMLTIACTNLIQDLKQ